MILIVLLHSFWSYLLVHFNGLSLLSLFWAEKERDRQRDTQFKCKIGCTGFIWRQFLSQCYHLCCYTYRLSTGTLHCAQPAQQLAEAAQEIANAHKVIRILSSSLSRRGQRKEGPSRAITGFIWQSTTSPDHSIFTSRSGERSLLISLYLLSYNASAWGKFVQICRVDLMIISSEYKMSNFISNMGLFLMIAAFTDGLPRRVQLFAHSPLQSIAGNIDSNHSVFFSQGPVLSYDSERMDFISGKTTSHCACICGTYAGRVGEYPIERYCAHRNISYHNKHLSFIKSILVIIHLNFLSHRSI